MQGNGKMKTSIVIFVVGILIGATPIALAGPYSEGMLEQFKIVMQHTRTRKTILGHLWL